MNQRHTVYTIKYFLFGLELHYATAAVSLFLLHSHSISHLFLIANKLSCTNRLQFDLLFDVC